jgi:hypothetical protein
MNPYVLLLQWFLEFVDDLTKGADDLREFLAQIVLAALLDELDSLVLSPTLSPTWSHT